MFFFKDNFYVSSKTPSCLYSNSQQRYNATCFPFRNGIFLTSNVISRQMIYIFVYINDYCTDMFLKSWSDQWSSLLQFPTSYLFTYSWLMAALGIKSKARCNLGKHSSTQVWASPHSWGKMWVLTFIKLKNGSSRNCFNTWKLLELHNYSLFFIFRHLLHRVF